MPPLRIDKVWRVAGPPGGGAGIYASAGATQLKVGPNGVPSAERFFEAWSADIPLNLDDAREARRAADFEKRLGPKAWSPHFPPAGRGIPAAERHERKMEEIRREVLADYEAVKWRILLVRELTGYVDDDSVDFTLHTPARVRVMDTSEEELLHRVDDWIDPYWNLDLLKLHPEIPGTATSLYMFGTSYNVATGEMQPARFEFE